MKSSRSSPLGGSAQLLGLALPLFVAPLAMSGCGDDSNGSGGSGGSTQTASGGSGGTGANGGTGGEGTSSTGGAGDGGGGAPSGGGGEGGAGGGEPSLCADSSATPPCFRRPIPVTTGVEPVTAIAIGQWDAVGADIIVAYGVEVAYFAGDGAGSLAGAPTAIAVTGVTTQVNDLVVGQLDDGTDLDIVVGDESSQVRVAFGDGAGAIAAQSTLTGEGSVFDVAVGDLVGSSGSQDLVSLNDVSGCGAIAETSGTEGPGFISSSASICHGLTGGIGRCSGAYSCGIWVDADAPSTLESVHINASVDPIAPIFEPALVQLEGAGGRLVVADFDSDGYDDVAVIVAGDKVNVLFSDAEGGWVGDTYVSYAVGTAPSDIAVGDFDGDDDLDLAVTDTVDDALSILTNDGSGVFARTIVPLASGAAPTRIAAGDVNGDGRDDLAVATSALSEVALVLYYDP